jgi:tetratricopeptide (TPR) repeat protein
MEGNWAMTSRKTLAATAALAFALSAIVPAAPAYAVGGETPSSPTTTRPDTRKPAKPQEGRPVQKPKPKPDKKSEQEFLDGYKQAYQLIYRDKDYAGGITLLRTLGRDDNADVANLIGFSSRKLGRMEDAKIWYEKALSADPNHTRTWQYYGMWQLEQGNRVKAEAHLEKIRAICGEDCDDYTSLRDALAGDSDY